MSTIKVDDITGKSSTGLSIHLSSSTPGSPTAGQIYYNSTTNKVLVYNGTAWEQVSNLTQASGGQINSYSVSGTNYVTHTFTASGVFTPASSFNVDYLIVGEKPTTKKVNNAKELNIDVITQEEWMKMLNKTS